MTDLRLWVGIAILAIWLNGCKSGGTPADEGHCGSTSECPQGQICLNSHCAAPGCQSDEQCLDGRCVDGSCQPSPCDCLPDSACTADDPSCQTPECTSDDDCTDDNECSADQCDDGQCSHLPQSGPGCCAEDGQCDDGSDCTVDYCLEGTCINEAVGGPGCCADDSECDDGDSCTVDFCQDGQCVHDDGGRTECCENDEACDDGDPCTEDLCAAGACQNDPVEQCCQSDDECNDLNACTLDACTQSRCTYTSAGLAGCCASDAECDDGDSCTADTCDPDNRICRHPFVSGPGCCQEDADCNDGVDCTEEFCCLADQCCMSGDCTAPKHCVYVVQGPPCCLSDTECADALACSDDRCVNGVCQHPATPDCCTTDDDCQDGDPCTLQRCGPDGQCLYETQADCCVDPADCDDGDDCTVDDCIQSSCRHDPIADCCEGDSDCDTGNPCVDAACQGGTCQYQTIFPCCDNDADCSTGDPCQQGQCQAGDCQFVPVSDCCYGDADCDDQDPCTTDRCPLNRCQHAPYSGPECCQPVRHIDADFDSGMAAPFTLQSAGGTVQWQVTAQGRSHSAPYALYYGQTTTWTYENGLQHTGTATSTPFALPQDDILFLAFWVYLDIDPTPTQDQFEVRVLQQGSPTVVWTKDALGGQTGGAFRFVSIDLAAYAGRTVQVQFAFNAVNASVHDGEGVYVDDVVLGSGCSYLPVECVTAADCADNDPCTDEDCVNNACVSFAVVGPTCCGARPFQATFDDGTLQDMETMILSGHSLNVGWTVDSRHFRSDPYAIYFGNPQTHLYADGANATGGVLQTQPLSVPAASILSFWLWLDVNPIGNYDSLVVELQPTAGNPVRLWSSLEQFVFSTDGEFVNYTVNLSAYQGQTVRLRFVFDTIDGFGNNYEGAYLDDLAIGSICL